MKLFKLFNIVFNQIRWNYEFYTFRQRWFKLNGHNSTNPKSIFPLNSVVVGNNSYGDLNIENYGNPDEKLIIGNYVSIGKNVTFILGGNHQISTITNYPLFSSFIEMSATHDAQTKGPIVIEDEVWIGLGSTILSGVRIGKGAIIGACAVVTKDIPPYAIVAGNPAKIIKYRFADSIIDSLKSFNLNDYHREIIKTNISEFYKPLDEHQLEKINKLRPNIGQDGSISHNC